MTIVVPVAGEFKFYPLQGIFRISLGTPVFFFFQLWSNQVRPVIAGLTAGVSVVLFRIVLLTSGSGRTGIMEAALLYFPVFFYYFTYGCLFQIFRVREHLHTPLLAGLLGTIIEIISSFTEIFVRSFSYWENITIKGVILVCIVAFIRSFFVLGLFYILIFSKVLSAEQALKKKNEDMLIHISNLMVETTQLKKSLHNIEQLTKNCYTLYNVLKNVSDFKSISKKVLKIATEVHEIKKDHQRIYAGLMKLMKKEQIADYMSIDSILHVVVSSNSSYGEILGKSIAFLTGIGGIHPFYHAYPLLSIINSLATNAVEAIEKSGCIAITADCQDHQLTVRISDDGPGIPDRNRDLIFQPGFTTKFDPSGQASTGIGLTYVKDFVEDLGGTICLDEQKRLGTTFIIVLPVDCISGNG